MRDSYQVLKDSIESVGFKQVASEIGISTALLYKWCQKSEETNSHVKPSGAMNPLDRIQKVYYITKDPQIVHWICEMANGFFVENVCGNYPDVDMGVLGNLQVFIKEFSETLDAISYYYQKDQQITSQEAIKIRKEWEDLKRIGEGFVTACEEGCFKKKGNI